MEVKFDIALIAREALRRLGVSEGCIPREQAERFLENLGWSHVAGDILELGLEACYEAEFILDLDDRGLLGVTTARVGFGPAFGRFAAAAAREGCALVLVLEGNRWRLAHSDLRDHGASGPLGGAAGLRLARALQRDAARTGAIEALLDEVSMLEALCPAAYRRLGQMETVHQCFADVARERGVAVPSMEAFGDFVYSRGEMQLVMAALLGSGKPGSDPAGVETPRASVMTRPAA